MKPLHFILGTVCNVRIQRHLQHSINKGENPVLLRRNGVEPPNCRHQVWIPDWDKVEVETYRRNRWADYMIPQRGDPLGIRKCFRDYGCDVVHAHNMEAAYYAVHSGLPVVFDDWEFYLKYLYYRPLIDVNNPTKHFHGLLECNPAGLPLKLLKRHRSTGVMEDLLKAVPVIVTNRCVKEAYEALGAHAFFVPNVPLWLERVDALAEPVEKEPVTTTGYVGTITNDNRRNKLRNMEGIPELWRKHCLGKLVLFEGKNVVPHPQMLRRMARFHFNLLYWQPRSYHRYYLQNKAFLASAVGVPTIITSSLEDTVALLGEYALPVADMEEIPSVMQRWLESPGRLPVKPEQYWEHYSSEVEGAYRMAVAS